MADSVKQAIRRILPGPIVAATRPLRLWFHPQRRFDRRWGVDTSTCVAADALDTDDERRRHASGYEPTPHAEFSRILASLSLNLEDYVFVDLGSGKGAVLLYAMVHPFRRVLGVELSPTLHRVAQRNVEQVRRRHPRLAARVVENLCMDVTDYRLPAEPAVIFLGNPFKGKTLDRVVDMLRSSLEAAPRDVVVIYFHPLSRHDAWDAAGFLSMRRRAPRHTIYRSRPPLTG